MSKDVDAVIAALRMVLHDAEHRGDGWWKVHVVNKWIDQLPGARWGKWRHLKLQGDNYVGDSALRPNLIAHVRATLAYLEVNRDQIKAGRRWRWPFSRTKKPEPIEAEFREVAEVPEKPAKKTGKSVRLIKGGE
ncbi:MAG: hypothetical protein AB7G08_31545 [Hyphomicrobiaceae bacterium]